MYSTSFTDLAPTSWHGLFLISHPFFARTNTHRRPETHLLSSRQWTMVTSFGWVRLIVFRCETVFGQTLTTTASSDNNKNKNNREFEVVHKMYHRVCLDFHWTHTGSVDRCLRGVKPVVIRTSFSQNSHWYSETVGCVIKHYVEL